MVISMLVSMLCILTLAADDPAPGVVLRITATLMNSKDVEFIADHTSFEDGWNEAMGLAGDSDTMKDKNYDRIVVDIYANWNANAEGKFTDDFRNGPGFDWDAIYIPDYSRVTLNLNGFTVNRGLKDSENNGEVICVDECADIIINNGTISGGNSDNGAGGIHVKDNAIVTLNDVNLKGNIVDDDEGGAIALYGGATLVMNGGSIVENKSHTFFVGHSPAGVYLTERSSATFKNVTFRNNYNTYSAQSGTLIFADEYSSVSLDNCQIIDNGKRDEANKIFGSVSIIDSHGQSSIEIKNTTFTGNGSAGVNALGSPNCLISVEFSKYLHIENCTFTNNSANHMIRSNGVNTDVINSRFINNAANVFWGYGNITFTDSVFKNNPGSKWTDFYSFEIQFIDTDVKFVRCDLGNSTFNDRERVTITATGVGSIFGEGSVAMIVAILALATAVASICLTVVKKKKTAPATENKGA